MPRPVKHSRDAILDAAADLILDAGAASASASAVAAAVGAPSGSVYHRFPRRDDLVAAAWLRAQDRFLGPYLEALGGSGPQAGPDAACTVLTWCAEHRRDAALLLRYGIRDLLRGDAAEAERRAGDNRGRLTDAIESYAARWGRPRADVVLAVADLPYATVRRLLRAQAPATADDVAALRRTAEAVLWPGGRVPEAGSPRDPRRVRETRPTRRART
ncbi:TetR family transcriptional regulator [Nocardiopsis coralliicola]